MIDIFEFASLPRPQELVDAHIEIMARGAIDQRPPFLVGRNMDTAVGWWNWLHAGSPACQSRGVCSSSILAPITEEGQGLSANRSSRGSLPRSGHVGDAGGARLGVGLGEEIAGGARGRCGHERVLLRRHLIHYRRLGEVGAMAEGTGRRSGPRLRLLPSCAGGEVDLPLRVLL